MRLRLFQIKLREEQDFYFEALEFTKGKLKTRFLKVDLYNSREEHRCARMNHSKLASGSNQGHLSENAAASRKSMSNQTPVDLGHVRKEAVIKK